MSGPTRSANPARLVRCSAGCGTNAWLAGALPQASDPEFVCRICSAIRKIVAIGLDWLLRSEQPEDAWMQHHGPTSPEIDNLRLRFIPVGARGAPVVVVDRAHWHYLPGGSGGADNPLTSADMSRVSGAIVAAGSAVASSWNGPPAITGSFALAGSSAPTLIVAVGRYLNGCPDHGSVFCGRAEEPCDWYARGHARIVPPDWSAACGVDRAEAGQ